MFKEGWPLAPLMKYISIHVCTHKKIIKMMFINAWWLKQSGSFGKKIMNKCNGTERNGRKDGFFARKACSVCVCSIHSFPFHSISFHFIRFHSVFPDKKWNGTEAERREGGRELFLRSGMERNGTETEGRRGRESKKLFVYYLENGNAPCYADVE